MEIWEAWKALPRDKQKTRQYRASDVERIRGLLGFLALQIKELKNGLKRTILLEFERKVSGRACCKS